MDGEREREGLELLAGTGRRMVEGVRRVLPGYLAARAGPGEAVTEAARAATERVAAELEALFALDPDEQRVTPLQVLRSAHRELTPLLRDAGVPPSARDEFARRIVPDDVYGLAPDSVADFGDEDLTALHLAWGAAKAMVHRARHAP